ncbi:MAG: autotransporter-associated beta strand repeat-containing protein [Thermoguttaceae bacterium]|jgi:autotransporter-associated beta strand protein|nr:autotransporter-associated beta strand repeat-containing protein [Thermoguttaceae bacterium]
MKPSFALLIAVSAVALAAVNVTRAAVLTYDADAVAPGPQDGAGAGWNTTNANFWNGSGNVVWPDTTTDEAVFGAGSGAAGSVSVGTVTANRVTFNAPGSGSYTLSGGTITLGGTMPTIAANVGATITSTIAGTSGLTKDGGSVLTLDGLLDYSGDTIVDGGTLVLNRAGLLQAGNTGQFGAPGHTITVGSDAILRIARNWTMGDGQQHHLIADGGTIQFQNSDNYQSSIELTGGTITSSGGTRPWRVGNYGNALITVNASDVSSTVSGTLCLVRTASANSVTFEVADGPAEHDLVFSAVIFDHPPESTYGGMVLVKDGPGTMLLSGANTYVGATRIDDGVLKISADNNLGAAPTSARTGHLVIASDGTLAVTSGFTLHANRGMTVGGTIHVAADQTLAYGGIAAGSGGLTKDGPGTLALGGANSYSGPTIISGGTLQIGADNNLGAAPGSATAEHLVIAEGAVLAATGSFTLHANRGMTVGGTLHVAADQTLTYNGIAAGDGGLTKDGPGTLTLGGPLDYSGETIVDGGMLVLNRSGGSLAAGITGQFTSSGHLITVNDGATLRVNQSYALGDGGQHQVVVNGGTLDFFSGDNYQSDITLTGAAITTGESGMPWRTGYHSGNALIKVLESDVSSTISGRLTFVRTTSGAPGKTTFNVADGAAEYDLILSAVILDHPGHENMALVKDGPGTMLLSGDNTFAGAVAIDGGTLVIGHQNALGATPKVVTLANTAGATLALGGFDLAVGSLAGGGTTGGEVALGGNTLTVGGLGTSTNYSGTVSGTGGIVKTGGGVLTLSGPLDYTGDTVVDAGTLVLNKPGQLLAGNTGQFGSSGHTITVNSGAFLRLAQSWTMGDGQQHHLVANGGTIQFQGSDNYQGSIELTGGAITTSGGTRPWRTGNYGNALITVNPSSVSSTISGTLCFVRRAGVAEMTTFFVADGPAEHDLIVSSVIFDHPPSGSTTYDGMILVKDGPGTMVFSGASTFAGGVHVDAGTLLVNNTADSGTGSGPVAVKGGATLGGTGSIAGATTVKAGGTLATGMSIGTLTFDSSLALEDGAGWDWEFINNTDGNYDQAVGGNDARLILPTGPESIALNIFGLSELGDYRISAGDRFTLFDGEVYVGSELLASGQNVTDLFKISDNIGWWGTWEVTGGSLILTAVPEPGAWLLLLSSLLCGLLVRRR